MGDDSARTLRSKLEHGAASPAEVVGLLAVAALDAPTRAARLDACELLGDLAGRALGAEWDVAERAAFALLEAARVADTAADRRGVIAAMGRGFRNIWLLPFVHRRLADRDEAIAAAALHAAGGLGVPALEEAVAAFTGEGTPPALRRAAVGALGRMGAASAGERLVGIALHSPDEAEGARAALTEIRSPAARAAVLELLAGALEPEVQSAAVRYLAERGALEVLPKLLRHTRSDLAEIRIAASLASRALKAERDRDPAERFLVALSEPDRAVRAQLARRLRTIPVASVLEQAEVLLCEDAAGIVQILGEVREPEITRYLLALAARDDLSAEIRARAIGAIEADQAWERDALAKLIVASEPADLRLAGYVALGERAMPNVITEVVAAVRREDDPRVLGAASNALIAAQPSADALAPLAGRAAQLLTAPDPRMREAGAEIAGLLAGAVPAAQLIPFAAVDAATVRGAAVWALGKLADPASEPALLAAFRDDDATVHERAAAGLLRLGTPGALVH